jgi:hypothetical protein
VGGRAVIDIIASRPAPLIRAGWWVEIRPAAADPASQLSPAGGFDLRALEVWSVIGTVADHALDPPMDPVLDFLAVA